MSEERVADLFDAWARTGRAERMESGHQATGQRALERFEPRPNGRFLDLGTGNGWAARVARSQGFEPAGIDLSPEMLSRARALGGATFLRAAFEQLPFRDTSFAAVFSMEALYYAGDLGKALGEIRRVSTPGAQIEIVIDRYAENDASHAWDTDLGLPMHLLAEREWVDRLRDTGFTDVVPTRLRVESDPGFLGTHGSLLLSALAPAARAEDSRRFQALPPRSTLDG